MYILKKQNKLMLNWISIKSESLKNRGMWMVWCDWTIGQDKRLQSFTAEKNCLLHWKKKPRSNS